MKGGEGMTRKVSFKNRQYFGGRIERYARQRADAIVAYWRRLFDGKTAVWAEVYPIKKEGK